MSSLQEKIFLLATRSTVATIACLLVGATFVYFVLFAGNKKLTAVENNTSREIKKDVHEVEKHIEPKKILEKKEEDDLAKTSNQSDASVKSVAKPEPFLAQYEATVAIVLKDAANYRPTPIDIKSTLAKSNSEKESTTKTVQVSREIKALESQQEITSKIKAPEPVLATFEATTTNGSLEAQNLITAIPEAARSCLAASNDTTDSTASESSKADAPMPEPPRPFLAAFEATTALTSLAASKYIALMPKAPEPFLAAYEATTAYTSLIAGEYIASLPKAPNPFLAVFEATTAVTTLEAQQFVAAMPKPPKPFLAAYEATTASTGFEASQNIKTIVSTPEYNQAITESLKNIAKSMVVSEPFLAEYEATTACCTETAQKYVANFVLTKEYTESLQVYHEKQLAASKKEPSNDISQYELTTASIISVSRKYISDLTLHDEYVNALKTTTSKLVATNMASSEPSTPYQSQQQPQQQVESDSDIEVEIEDNVLSSPSAISSISSTASSENEAASIDIDNQPHHIDTIDKKTQLDVSWDQMYSLNNSKKVTPVLESPKSATPFMPTVECIYYPNCTNKNCKFVHPGNENNSKPKPKRAATMDTVYKKPLTKAELIEKQSQSHFPTWKSRCVHWPYCTNNHCKYSHPIKECRMGEQCTFMERCMFLHPSDFLEPVKKRQTPKRSNTLPLPTQSKPHSLTQV